MIIFWINRNARIGIFFIISCNTLSPLKKKFYVKTVTFEIFRIQKLENLVSHTHGVSGLGL